jgi:hypothetical protein
MSSGPPEKPTTRNRAWLIAPVMFLLLVAAGAHWKWTRARAHQRASVFLERATALRECVVRATGEFPTLTEAVSFALIDDKPLAECSESLSQALDAARQLGELRPLMDRNALDEAVGALGALRQSGFDTTAGELAASHPSVIEDQLDRLAQSTCRVAISENAADYQDCALPRSRVPPFAPPTPHTIVNEKTSWIEHAALRVATSGEGRVSVLVGTREREALRTVARVASSSDAGARWTVATFECEEASLGDPDAPELTFDPASGAPRLFFMALRAEKGVFAGGTLGRVAEDLRSIRYLSDVPQLPDELEPVRTGSPLVELEGGSVGLLLAPRKAGPGGGVLVLKDKSQHFTPLAHGRLIAGQSGPPPRVVTVETASDGATSVAVVGLEADGHAFAAPAFEPLGAKAPTPAPTPERLCGAAGHRSSPILWRDATESRLGLLGTGALDIQKLASPRGGALDVTCGGCAPFLFWHSETDLAFVVPGAGGARQVAVAMPVLYSAAKSWRTATSGCSADRVAVAYVQDGSLYVQTADSRRLSFSRPRLLATRNDAGAPTDVAIAGSGRRLLVVWRRAAPRPVELRIEMLASDDGGNSWH